MVVTLDQINRYAEENKKSRSSKAWELAQTHYDNISGDNTALIKAICQEGYAKSSSFFGLFRRTKTNLDEPESISNASSESRTGRVRDILSGSLSL